MSPKSVFIGVPINDEKIYCFESFVAGLKRLIEATDLNVTLAFTVNSTDIRIVAALKDSGLKHSLLAVPRRAVTIPRDHVYPEPAAELATMLNITLARNVLRETALINGDDWFFMLDSDGCVQPDTINKLLIHNLPASTCVFAQRSFDDGANPLDPESMVEHEHGHYGWSEVESMPNPIMNAGHSFGCCLIRRDVLEQNGFNFMTRGQAVERSEDYTFFRQLRERGTPFGCDQSIKTIHFMCPDRYPFGWASDNSIKTYDGFCQFENGQ